MAADLDKLQLAFKSKVVELVNACIASGVNMRPNAGLRDPFEQGRLWRQSRSLEEIKVAVSSLKSKNAPFLAHCIESVGPQHGKHVTNAMPGSSWHQWGEAIDFFWLVDGKANWSTQSLVNGVNGYKVLAGHAGDLGLDAGGMWAKFKDWPHVQLRHDSSPFKIMSYEEINKVMEERFGS